MAHRSTPARRLHRADILRLTEWLKSNRGEVENRTRVSLAKLAGSSLELDVAPRTVTDLIEELFPEIKAAKAERAAAAASVKAPAGAVCARLDALEILTTQQASRIKALEQRMKELDGRLPL